MNALFQLTSQAIEDLDAIWWTIAEDNRDAAERVLRWDYGRPGAVEEMLGEFELLVAARRGEFEPPKEFSHRIHSLAMRSGFDEVSSTEVRERIAGGEPWEHLVPEDIVDRVREIYS